MDSERRWWILASVRSFLLWLKLISFMSRFSTWAKDCLHHKESLYSV
jgi:hypothetical protein